MNTVRKYDDAELPDGWRMVRLGDVVEINRRSWDPNDGTPISYLDLTAVISPGRLDEPKALAAKDAPSRARRHVLSGDVLVSTVRPNLRGFARVRNAADNLVASTGFAVLTPLSGVNGSFVYHHVMTERFAANLEGAATGQAYPAVRSDDVSNFRVPLPPLHEQRAIADVLDSIDEAIERTEEVIAAIETLRDSLLHELLTRGVPGWHTEWKDVSGIGTIPADWDVVRLREVLESTTYGTNEPLGATGNIAVLRMNNIQRGEIDWSEVKRGELSDSELNDLDLRSGDILFNRTNSLDLVGKIGIVREMPDTASFASYLIRLRTKTSQAKPTWLAALLGSSTYQARIRRFATPGVSQANINPTSLKSLAIPLPSIAEQDQVIAVLDGTREELQHVRREHEALSESKSAFADALLSGRIRYVRELPTGHAEYLQPARRRLYGETAVQL